MNKLLATCLLVSAPLSPLAAANPVDNYAEPQIAAAQYASAIARLEAQKRADPMDESTLLNLALAYRHSGRMAEAAKLYRRVLQLENAQLNTTIGKPMWSHDVARAALTPTTLTMR